MPQEQLPRNVPAPPNTYEVDFGQTVTLTKTIPNRDPKAFAMSRIRFSTRIDAGNKWITAVGHGIPVMVALYGPTHFAGHAADTTEQFKARLVKVLGDNPQATLQAIMDDTSPFFNRPEPAAAPAEIASWRAKAVLEIAGLLPQIEAALAALEGEAGIAARAAWANNAPLLRNGPTVVAMAAALNLTDTDVDNLFTQADALQV